jgi:hypothetical protein
VFVAAAVGASSQPRRSVGATQTSDPIGELIIRSNRSNMRRTVSIRYISVARWSLVVGLNACVVSIIACAIHGSVSSEVNRTFRLFEIGS